MRLEHMPHSASLDLPNKALVANGQTCRRQSLKRLVRARQARFHKPTIGPPQPRQHDGTDIGPITGHCRCSLAFRQFDLCPSPPAN